MRLGQETKIHRVLTITVAVVLVTTAAYGVWKWNSAGPAPSQPKNKQDNEKNKSIAKGDKSVSSSDNNSDSDNNAKKQSHSLRKVTESINDQQVNQVVPKVEVKSEADSSQEVKETVLSDVESVQEQDYVKEVVISGVVSAQAVEYEAESVKEAKEVESQVVLTEVVGLEVVSTEDVESDTESPKEPKEPVLQEFESKEVQVQVEEEIKSEVISTEAVQSESQSPKGSVLQEFESKELQEQVEQDVVSEAVQSEAQLPKESVIQVQVKEAEVVSTEAVVIKAELPKESNVSVLQEFESNEAQEQVKENIESEDVSSQEKEAIAFEEETVLEVEEKDIVLAKEVKETVDAVLAEEFSSDISSTDETDIWTPEHEVNNNNSEEYVWKADVVDTEPAVDSTKVKVLSYNARVFIPGQQYRNQQTTSKNNNRKQLTRIELIDQQRQHYTPHAKARCSHWPRCTNKNCKFWHPSRDCRDGNTCYFGNKCLFIHPADYAEPRNRNNRVFNNRVNFNYM